MKVRKGFLFNMIFLIGVNILVKPFWIFGIDRTVQNLLGEEVYGRYFALLGFSLIFQVILDFGIQYFNSRNVAAHPRLIRKYFRHMISLKLLLFGLYFLFTSSVAFFVGYGLGDYPLLILLLLNQALVSLIFFMRSNLSGSLLFMRDSVLSVLDKLLMIGLCSLLIWGELFGGLTILSFVAVQTISYGVTLLAAIVISGPLKLTWNPRFKAAYILMMFRKSIPYALAVFLMSVFTRVDAVMIERLLGGEGAYQAGLYAQSYRIMDGLNMIGLLMASQLLPVFTRLLEDRKGLFRMVAISSNWAFMLAAPLAYCMVLFNEGIIEALYVNSTAEAAGILFYLGIAHFAFIGMYIFGTLLTAGEHLARMNRLFLFGVLLNIALNYWLIHSMGARGAALATMVTQMLMFLGELILVVAYFKPEIRWKPVLRVGVFLVLLFAAAALLRNISGLWVSVIGTCLFSVILAVLSGMIGKEDFRAFLPPVSTDP